MWSLHLQPDGATIAARSWSRAVRHHVNPAGRDLLLLCNGARTVADLIENDEKSSHANFLLWALEAGIIDIYDTPLERPPLVSGSNLFYSPYHIVIELTDACNMRCQFCYRDSSSARTQHINAQLAFRTLDEMSSAGVRAVELSGGEPLLHPNAVQLISFCLQNFELVCLLTNGWHLTSEKLDQMLKFRRSAPEFLIQIDLDGPSAEIHDNIRGLDGSFARACEAIKLAVKRAVPCKVAMTVTQPNLHVIEEVLLLARRLGATVFSCATVVDFGRGCQSHLSYDETCRWHKTMERIREKYGDFIFPPKAALDDLRSSHKRCGAGWRMMVLSPNADMRFCPLADPQEGHLGTVVNGYGKFLETAPTKLMKDTPLPCADTCAQCDVYPYCVGCLARPFRVKRKALKENRPFVCNWNKQTRFLERLSGTHN